MEAIPSFPGTVWALIERAADRWQDHVVLADGHGRSLTGAQFHDAALGVAADLAARGIGTGTVVSWQLPTTLETMVVKAALVRLGAVQNPLVPILREREVRFITEHVGTEVMITCGEWRGFDHATLAQELAAEHGFAVIVTDVATDPVGMGHRMRLEQGDPAQLGPAPVQDDAAVRWIFPTSGTTSDPKCVRHTDRTVMHSATGPIQALGATPDDVNSLAFPIAHVGGITTLTAALMTGMCLTLFDKFDAATTPERMAACGSTIMGNSVPFYVAYFDAQRRHGDTPMFPSLRILVGGGAPTPVEMKRMARDVFGVPGIVSSWGLTEFPAATFARFDAPAEVLDFTTGPAVAGVEVRAVADDGRVCAPGEEGELRLRGPQLFLGYVDSRLDADAFDDDGWFRTGDLGIIDTGGNVRISGRLKDVIIRNAENISAREVEEALFSHGGVADVAVVAAPDPRTGEHVCAFVVPSPGHSPTLAELGQHCRALGLAIQKCPEQLVIVDQLPRNSMAKVLKQELRARLS